MQTLLWPTINVVVLVAVLARFLKSPLQQFVAQRHHSIKSELEDVREQLVAAQAKHEEFTAKLKALGAEVVAMRNQSLQDAKLIQAKVLADAQRVSEGLLAGAEVSARALYQDFAERVRVELANKVLSRAEALLRERLTGEDRVRICREFSKQVERVQ